MIMFRCACGVPHVAEDKFGGGSVRCRKCGAEVAIPRSSDPEVVLIYKAGDAEDGAPMLRTEMERHLVVGELAPTDLIWHGNTWCPLADVVMGPGAAADKAQPDPLADASGPAPTPAAAAAADGIGELIPINVPPIGGARSEPPQRKRFSLSTWRSRRRQSRAAPATEAAEAPSPATKSRRLTVAALQLILAVVAVYCGYRFGFGPVISTLRDRPTKVFVVNESGKSYDAVLGWRRTRKSLPQQGAARFETAVGMRERQTLSLYPTDGGEPIKIKALLRPGYEVKITLAGDGTVDIQDKKIEKVGD